VNDEISRSLTLFKRLAAINRTISRSLDFDEALGLIAGSGVEYVGATSCVVLLREGEGQLRICAAQGVEAPVAERFVGAMEESVLDRLRESLGFPVSQSIAAAPIMTDYVLKGILVVMCDDPLDAEGTLLLSALAEQAAIALGNAHHHESLVAREAEVRVEARRSGKIARELEALVHSIADYLKAPLGTMKRCGDLLVDGGVGPVLTAEGRACLARLASDARTMDGLIDGLSTYCQLAHADISLDPVDLEGAVQEALADLGSEIERRGARVRVETPLVQVLAHRGTLVRMLANLLSHAVKAACRGGTPVVIVKAELRGDYVHASVLDDGSGFQKIFPSPISGAADKAGLAEDDPDTDIALAIVQRGAERMGGRFGVDTESGYGVRHWLELRRA